MYFNYKYKQLVNSNINNFLKHVPPKLFLIVLNV